MTALKCQRCGNFWTMTTKSPDLFTIIHRFCPECIERIVPIMGGVAS